jgi:phage terminase Nu1 subunit (DNA packaging protein)
MRTETTLPREVSSAELAALFGVTTKTISLWAKDGIAARTKYGRFDLARSVQGYARHHREAAKHAATTPGLETGAEARARLARLKADIAEAEYKRGKGELVDGGEILAQLDKRMSVYWREVRQIPWVLAGTLSFVDREMATLIGRELHRCLSNIGHGRPPNENGPDTDFDDVAEHSLMASQGKGVLSADGERIAAEARARHGLPPKGNLHNDA